MIWFIVKLILAALALRCEQAYGPRRDIEWAMQDGQLYLLQCRAVTTGQARLLEQPAHRLGE